MKNKVKVFIALMILCSGLIFAANFCFAQEADLKVLADTIEQSQQGMTLWQVIKTGGFIMVVLALISIAALAIIVYNWQNLKVSKLVPREPVEQILQKLEKGQFKLAQELCQSHDNIVSRIVSAGIEKRAKGALVAREAMENSAKREVAALWQNISYLADIAAVAPMVGLLGTVLGMIQAFNVIAFQTAVVKPILLAGGVSKAMVTTAGGLFVAIPAMILYAVFRARVQEVSNTVESYSADIIKIIEEA